jgi:hypothetical protein
MAHTMGKARRKSTAPVPLDKALKQAAKRLGIADLNYAKIRLCEQLKTAEFGRDWGVQAVHPPNLNVVSLWRDSVWWKVNWEERRAEQLAISLIRQNRGDPPRIVSAGRFAIGLWVAPAVIESLASAVSKGKSPGPPSKYNDAWLAKQAWKYINKHGHPNNVEGEGGLIEKVTDIVGANRMPGRTRSIEILAPILKEAKARSAK